MARLMRLGIASSGSGERKISDTRSSMSTDYAYSATPSKKTRDGMVFVSLRQRRRDIGVHEIVAFEQKGLARRARQGVSEAIAEIQPRWVAAAPAKVAICLTGDPRLNFGNSFDDQLRLLDEIVKTAAGDRITAAVDDDCSFDEAGGRDAATGSRLDGLGASRPLG